VPGFSRQNRSSRWSITCFLDSSYFAQFAMRSRRFIPLCQLSCCRELDANQERWCQSVLSPDAGKTLACASELYRG
jgi:hypothetical protein